MNKSLVFSVALALVSNSATAQKPSHEWEFSKAGMARNKGSLRGPGAMLQPPLPEALVFRAREPRATGRHAGEAPASPRLQGR